MGAILKSLLVFIFVVAFSPNLWSQDRDTTETLDSKQETAGGDLMHVRPNREQYTSDTIHTTIIRPEAKTPAFSLPQLEPMSQQSLNPRSLLSKRKYLNLSLGMGNYRHGLMQIDGKQELRNDSLHRHSMAGLIQLNAFGHGPTQNASSAYNALKIDLEYYRNKQQKHGEREHAFHFVNQTFGGRPFFIAKQEPADTLRYKRLNYHLSSFDYSLVSYHTDMDFENNIKVQLFQSNRQQQELTFQTTGLFKTRNLVTHAKEEAVAGKSKKKSTRTDVWDAFFNYNLQLINHTSLQRRQSRGLLHLTGGGHLKLGHTNKTECTLGLALLSTFDADSLKPTHSLGLDFDAFVILIPEKLRFSLHHKPELIANNAAHLLQLTSFVSERSLYSTSRRPINALAILQFWINSELSISLGGNYSQTYNQILLINDPKSPAFMTIETLGGIVKKQSVNVSVRNEVNNKLSFHARAELNNYKAADGKTIFHLPAADMNALMSYQFNKKLTINCSGQFMYGIIAKNLKNKAYNLPMMSNLGVDLQYHPSQKLSITLEGFNLLNTPNMRFYGGYEDFGLRARATVMLRL
ncbi:MAG: hypothetical protein EAZ57_03355 [Cytophagales bacterium]|nr:MAG: hypothetical protein EAZ67_03820 [Cytophagales bacterium]TAF61500.1 MAG: hypothetical protein EAZ57_03355 [Cytophagales bacterium]